RLERRADGTLIPLLVLSAFEADDTASLDVEGAAAGDLDLDGGAEIDAAGRAADAELRHAVLHALQLADEVMGGEAVQLAQRLGRGVADLPRFADGQAFSRQQ